MTEPKKISVVVTSIEARDGGKAVAMVRITNPYSDTDFYMQVPADNIGSAMRDAQKKVYEFANSLVQASGVDLTFTK